MAGRRADAVVLSAGGRDFLEAQVRRHKTPRSLSDRCRIWSAFGLQPHRSRTFKLSTDPLCVDKVQDIVGL